MYKRFRVYTLRFLRRKIFHEAIQHCSPIYFIAEKDFHPLFGISATKPDLYGLMGDANKFRDSFPLYRG